MPLTQDSQTTFKLNLTCIFLSTRTRYIMSNPDETPCRGEGGSKILKMCLRNIWMISCTRNDASFKNVMISIFDFNFRVRNLSRFCWIAPRVELSWSTWKRDMKIMVFKQCWQKTFMAFQGENIEKKNFPSPSQICKTN